jgi:hypothetical protein
MGKKADEWACAILIMFQPHPHHYSQDQPFSNETDFSWEAFMNYYNTLRKSNRCIDKMRLRFMLNFSTSLISTNKHRICYGEFRHRASTKWTREEKDEINAMFPNGVDSRPLNCDADEEEVIADYTSYHLNKARQFHDHCNILKDKIEQGLSYDNTIKPIQINKFQGEIPCHPKKEGIKHFQNICPFQVSSNKKDLDTKSKGLSNCTIPTETSEDISNASKITTSKNKSKKHNSILTKTAEAHNKNRWCKLFSNISKQLVPILHGTRPRKL